LNYFKSVLAVLLCSVMVHSQAMGQSLLLMPEPLDGYVISKAAVGSVEEPQGYLITAEREGVVDKVQIVVELRDVKDVRARVAAAKGYVNGFSTSLTEAGLEVTDKDIPEITTRSVRQKIVANVNFAQPDGSKILTRHHIFFDTYGYNARVIATSEESMKTLSDWAKQIRPAEPVR
jgi:hypothetical protein